jgi:ElaB/YqjD/DUF883 family membrane-anchored ribosome-binding protein
MANGRRTAEETTNTAGHLADRVVGDMSEFADKAKRALGGASEFASDVGYKVARGGKKAGKFVVREVREHPLRTLAIGAAIGAVVAAVIMLRHKSDDEE